MAERDYSPLNASCVRALNDKLYEKRKVAALEIEKMVKEYVATNKTAEVKKLLRVLGQEFALSQNANSRKGGLIGLAASAIALGKDSPSYINDLVKPVLTCFFDSDSRVRYYGCESLYNIIKVARTAILPFFNDIFDGLSKLAADPDQNVRSGSELLDKLMKDIVTDSCAFDPVAFMPLLQERILTKNPFARQFIVSWVKTLDSVPDIDMLVYLPEILDGLFLILGDTSHEIRQMCEGVLGEFLLNISKSKKKIDFQSMANILVVHSQSPDGLIQFTAIVWLKHFIELSDILMLPFTSGILASVLPCLAYDDETKPNIREAARDVNDQLMKLIQGEEAAAEGIKDEKSNLLTENNGKDSQIQVQTEPEVIAPELDVPSVVTVLTRQLLHDSMPTRITALRWIYHLFTKLPTKMFHHVEELFPLLLKTLSDPSDEVVVLDLKVLAEISSSRAGIKSPPPKSSSFQLSANLEHAFKPSHNLNEYFTYFLISLLKLFGTDRQLVEDRGSFIIRELCLLLNPEDIYSCCSEILVHEEEDLVFASRMTRTLSTILLTSTELFELRMELKELKTAASVDLFICLYKSWCHNPVSTVALCFLTQNYRHASQLLGIFGDLEVTVEFLVEIDKLVQLIESPIFTYLRLQLLDEARNRFLLKSLYGLLMLLPQSDAFHILQHRLQCIPSVHFSSVETRLAYNQSEDERTLPKKIDFEDLLKYFRRLQEKHRAQRRVPHRL